MVRERKLEKSAIVPGLLKDISELKFPIELNVLVAVRQWYTLYFYDIHIANSTNVIPHIVSKGIIFASMFMLHKNYIWGEVNWNNFRGTESSQFYKNVFWNLRQGERLE